MKTGERRTGKPANETNSKFAFWCIFSPSHGQNHEKRLTFLIDTISGQMAANLTGG